MQPPATRYIDRRGKSLAYQAFGRVGPRAVVLCHEAISHLDLLWTDPAYVEQCRRLAADVRTVAFQQLGVGLSDGIERVPTLEEQASDIGAVMDAEGLASAVLFAVYSTAMPAVLFAAQSPGRVDGLVLFCPLMQGLRHSGPEHTAGFTPDEGRAALTAWENVFARWGEGRTIDVWDPVIAARNRPVIAMLERTSATPSVAAALFEAAATSDVSDVLPLVQAPTRVLHHPSFSFPRRSVELVAERIPGATFHELRPSAPYMRLNEAAGPVWDHLHEAATGTTRSGERGRELTTLMFTDVVGSTELVDQRGDLAWSDLARRHEHQIRTIIDESGGELIKMLGDGSLSVLPGPAAALRCARAIVDQAQPLGLTIRVGVHTGECQRSEGDVLGIAVHIAARIAALAGPGEIWVSRTVRDIVGGSGLTMSERGTHSLKGVSEPWTLYQLLPHDADVTVWQQRSELRALDRLVLTAARRAPRVMRAVNRLDAARHRRQAGGSG
ncbi:MAG TPA: adenylate/guanylate cyclase domain-containing protein [Solirubrobacteraceae bacterium]